MGAIKTPVWINTEEKSNAERILLGAMLREPYKLADHMAGLVQPALATSGRYAAAFGEIFNQFSTRGMYSAATVATRTANNDLYQVAAENPDIDLSWAADNWWAVYRVWAEVQAFTFAQAPDVSVLGADAMRAKIEEVREMLGANGVLNIENYRQTFAERAVAKLDGNETEYATRPHMDCVRSIKRYFEPGTVTVIAARPGMGKTQFMLNTYSHFLDCGARGMVFSLEMKSEKLLERLLGIRHGINPIGDWSQLDKNTVQQAIHEVATLETCIIDDKLIIEEVEAAVSAAFYKGDLGFMMFDYIQIAQSSRRFGTNREMEVAHVMRTLLRIAKRFNIPVIALSQLSRDVEKRGGSKRPGLSDLRESGSIEQDADTVLFLFRPEYYDIAEDDAGNSTKGVAEVIIAKQRNGHTKTAICRYDPVRGYRDPKPQQPFSPVAPGFDVVDFTEKRPRLGEDIPF
jgi:KaiC/GvpD/RAD55 family RecA-like ATPase